MARQANTPAPVSLPIDLSDKAALNLWARQITERVNYLLQQAANG